MNKDNHREVATWVIGKRIQKIRLQKNIKQAQLAEVLGCRTSYISEIENGTTNANLETLQKICDYLDIKLSDLLAYAMPSQDFMIPDFQMLFEQMSPGQLDTWKAVLSAWAGADLTPRQTENPIDTAKETNGKQPPKETP